MYKIILVNGTIIDNLELNGNNFIPKTPIDINIFNGNLDKISIIDSEENIEELNNCSIVFAEVVGKQSFIVVEKAKEEVEKEELRNLINANLKATRKLVRQDVMTAEELLELIDIYPKWEESLIVKVDELYKHEDGLYKVIQGHTTQSDWKPDVNLSLFNKVQPTVVIPNWIQPVGAHDSYQIDNQVIYNEVVWISKINANTTVPDGDTPYNRYWDLA